MIVIEGRQGDVPVGEILRLNVNGVEGARGDADEEAVFIVLDFIGGGEGNGGLCESVGVAVGVRPGAGCFRDGHCGVSWDGCSWPARKR